MATQGILPSEKSKLQYGLYAMCMCVCAQNTSRRIERRLERRYAPGDGPACGGEDFLHYILLFELLTI